MRQMLHHPTYQMSDNDLRDHLLDTLEDLLTRRGSSINNFNLPIKCSDISPNSSNRLFDEELCYNTDIVMTESKNMTSQLNKEQCHAFNCIVNVVLSNKPGFFFVSGYGGTGKNLLMEHNNILPSCAKKDCSVSSIIWSCFFTSTGGRTTRSHFKIPCDNLDETTTCNIKRGTILCELIQAASLIIWDEALMTQNCF
jgi:hypothetical protein